MDRIGKDPVRHERMRRAVETFPREVEFDAARRLLASAMVLGAPRDDLLIALQPERETVERRAIRAGLPPSCLNECRFLKQHAPGQCEDRRTGVFETDVVEIWLPEYLTKVQIEEQRWALPSFALHTSDIYRDRLRQMTRRERNRAKLLQAGGGDDRSRVECMATNPDGESGSAIAPAMMAAWVPSPEDVVRTNEMRKALHANLDPLDYRVAELMMAGMVHQGDRGDIAASLGVSPSRITTATARIAKVLEPFWTRARRS